MSALLLLIFIIAPYAGIAMLITGIVLFLMSCTKKDAADKTRLRSAAARYSLAGGICLLVYACFVLWLRAHPPDGQAASHIRTATPHRQIHSSPFPG